MAGDPDKSILQRVTDITAEVLKVEPSAVLPSADMRNDLGADSVDLLTLVFALEEEFNGKIPDDEMMNIKTVGDAVSLIETHIVKSE